VEQKSVRIFDGLNQVLTLLFFRNEERGSCLDDRWRSGRIGKILAVLSPNGHSIVCGGGVAHVLEIQEGPSASPGKP